MRITDIIGAVSDYFAIPEPVLRGSGRLRSIVRARHVAMFIAREQGYGWTEIGFYFGRRHHTTAISGVRAAANWMRRDPNFARQVGIVREMLEKDLFGQAGWTKDMAVA